MTNDSKVQQSVKIPDNFLNSSDISFTQENVTWVSIELSKGSMKSCSWKEINLIRKKLIQNSILDEKLSRLTWLEICY